MWSLKLQIEGKKSEMAKLKTLLICVIVLAIVTSSLAEQKKQQNRNKSKKRVQADAPLPSKAKCMCLLNIPNEWNHFYKVNEMSDFGPVRSHESWNVLEIITTDAIRMIA